MSFGKDLVNQLGGPVVLAATGIKGLFKLGKRKKAKKRLEAALARLADAQEGVDGLVEAVRLEGVGSPRLTILADSLRQAHISLDRERASVTAAEEELAALRGK